MYKYILYLISIFTFILPKYLCGRLEPVGSNFLKPYASNKGETTFYKFEFLPENEILRNAKVKIQFPQEYTIYDFSEELECSTATKGGEYQEKSCKYTPGHIIEIDIGQILIIETNIIIGMITNPTDFSASSQFRMMSYYNDVIIDSNQGFGFVSYSKVPGSINSPSVTIISNQRISEGSTYEFRFTSSSNYYGSTTVRFTFPDGFTSQSAMCDVQNLVGLNPTTKVFHNKRIIGCIKAQKDILNTEVQVVKIINMVNPNFKGDFDGFKIEIMDGDSSIILEKVEYPTFSDSITILPGELDVSYYAPEPFKQGIVEYGFQINLVNKVDSNGRLYLNFTNDWTMIEDNCNIISGVNMLPDRNATCTLIDQEYSYKIEGFESIGPETQIVVSMIIQAPDEENNFPVEIGTYNGLREAQIDYKVIDVAINDTYGINTVWRAHPIRSPVTLKAGETGPLEIIFFLKTELLKTNVGSFGKFRIDIFPAIPVPDANTYGQLKCFFYADIPSDDCTYVPTAHGTANGDSTMEHTIIQMKTPLDYSFKESEIPLTITTAGAQPGEPTGIKLDKIVKRYVFQIHMFTSEGLANQNIVDDTPVEFYFTEFVPVPYELDTDDDGTDDNDVTCSLQHLSKQQYTGMTIYLKQNVIDNFNDEYVAYKRNYKIRIRVNNDQSGWDKDSSPLGWDNDIYYEYPCVITSPAAPSMIDSAQKLRCDLYAIGQTETTESFIDVYGFHTEKMVENSTIQIEIPHLKLGDANQKATVDVMIAEETPGMRDDIVVFAIKRNVECGIITNDTPANNLGISSSADTDIVNEAPVFTWSFTGITAGADWIYVFIDDDADLPKMSITGGVLGDGIYQQVTSGSHTLRLFGGVVNQIHIAKTGSTLSATETVTIPNTIFTNPPYKGTWTFTAKTVAGNQLTQYKDFSIVIDKELFTTKTFAKVDTTLYENTEHEFSVSFTTMNKLQDNGSIQLTFTGITPQTTEHYFCKITGLTQYIDSGIQCYNLNPTTVVIDNISEVAAGTAITINLKLNVGTSGSSSVDINTYWDIARTLEVDYGTASATYTLGLPITGKFEIANPAIIDEVPCAGYVGKFEFYYTHTESFTAGGNTSGSLNLKLRGFQNFRSGQPLICFIYTPTKTQINCSGNPSSLTISIPTLTQNLQYKIDITTEEASPENGLLFPQNGGIYKQETFLSITSFRNSYTNCNDSFEICSGRLYSGQFYIINPERMKYTYIQFLTDSANSPNIFTIQFQVSQEVSPYNAGTTSSGNNGRLYIEFPRDTDDEDNGFADDLGGYLNTGDGVGCYVVQNLAAQDANLPVSCKLIKATVSGQPSYVEVMNFNTIAADTEVIIKIAHVYNPVNTVENIKIGVLTLDIDLDTGVRTYKNYGSDNIFLNSKGVTPTTVAHTTPVTFNTGSKVDLTDQTLKNTLYYDTSLAAGDYILVKLPSDISINSGDNTLGAFESVINFHDSNMILYELNAATADVTTPKVADAIIASLPSYVEQSTQDITYYIYSAKEYKGTVTNVISEAAYKSLNTDFTTPTVTFAGHTGKAIADKDYAEYLVKFTLKSPINEGGTIEITFPSDFQELYPNCRSAINKDSELFSLAGDNSGDIGCEVQSSRRWVITGFKAIEAAKVVEIYGFAKNVASGGTMNPGTFEIRTYYDTHDTDVYTNGNIISHQDSISLTAAITDTAPIQINDKYTFLQTDYLQPDYIGPFKLSVILDQNVLSSGNMVIKLSKIDIYGASTGFQTDSLEDEKVCYFLKASDDTIIGCTLTISNSNAYYMQYTLVPDSTIDQGVEYIVVIDAMHKDVAATQNGIKYPSQSGIYKVEVSLNSNNSYNSLYIEVYPVVFTNAQFLSYNYAAGRQNYLDVTVQPSVALAVDDLLVIEINTASPSGATYYEEGSVQYSDFEDIKFDLVWTSGTSPITSLSCKYLQGLASTGQTIKIVCTNFNVVFNTGVTARLIFELINSEVSTTSDHYYIPVSIYTFDISAKKKKNFQFFDKGIYVVEGTVTDETGTDPSWTLGDTEVGATTTFGMTTPANMAVGDSFILKVEFDLVSSKIQDFTNAKAIYCDNIKAIIIVPTGTINAGVISITDHVNQNALLTSNERITFGYNSFYGTKTTVIYDFTAYPVVQLTYTPTALTGFTVALKHSQITESKQYNDLIFSVECVKFSEVKRVSFLTTGLSTLTSFDCQESSGSEVTVKRCYVETQGAEQILNVDIDTNSFATNKVLKVETRNFSHLNQGAAIDMTSWQARSLSWNTADIPADLQTYTNDDYLIFSLDGTGNFDPTFTTTIDVAVPNYFEIPYERYVQEFLPYANTHYFPIEFDYKIPVDLSPLTGGDYHILTVNYPSDLSLANTVSTTTDVSTGRVWCHIQNVYINICYIDDSAKTVSVYFQDAYSQNDIIHVRLSQINPLEYPKKEGFKWTSTTNNLGKFVTELTENGVATKHVTILNPIHMYLSNSSHLNYITDLTVTNANAFAGNYNYINVEFTFSQASQVDYIVLEINTVGIYTQGQMHGLESGERFPCSPGAGLTSTNLICVFQQGSSTDSNRPQKIHITNFTITGNSNKTGSVNLVIKNPDEADGTNFGLTLKAYGGTGANELFSGALYYGQIEKLDIFATITDAEVPLTTSIFKPQSILTKQGDIQIENPDNTNNPVLSGSVSLLYIPISLDQSSHPLATPCQFDFTSLPSGYTVNYIEVGGELFVYLAITHAADHVDSTPMTFTNFMTCEYFTGSWKLMHLLATDKIVIYTADVDATQVETLGDITIADHADTAVQYFGKVDGATTGYVEITYDLSVLVTKISSESINLDKNRILEIDITPSGATELFFDHTQTIGCSIVSGITNSDKGQNVLCATDGTNKYKITITNFDGINNSVKILYTGTYQAITGTVSGVVVTLYPRSESTTYTIIKSQSFALALPAYLADKSATITYNTDLTYDDSTKTLSWDFTVTASQDYYNSGALNQQLAVILNFYNFKAISSSISSQSLTMTVNSFTCGSSSFTGSTPNDQTVMFSIANIGLCINASNAGNSNYLGDSSGSDQYWLSTQDAQFVVSITFSSDISQTNMDYEFQKIGIAIQSDISSSLTTIDEEDKVYYLKQKPSTATPTINSLSKVAGTSYTELQVQFTTNFALAANGKKLLLEFVTIDWGTELVYGTGTTEQAVEFPCMCGSSQQTCIRYQGISGQTGMSIAIKDLSVSQGGSVNCFIPGVILPGIANQDIYVKIIEDLNYLYSTQSQIGTMISSDIINIAFDQAAATSVTTGIAHTGYNQQVNTSISGYQLTITTDTSVVQNFVVAIKGDGFPTWTGSFCSGFSSCRHHQKQNGLQFITGQIPIGQDLQFSGGTATAQNFGTSDIDIQVNTYTTAGEGKYSGSSTLNYANPNVASPSITMKPTALQSSNIEGQEATYIITASIGTLSNLGQKRQIKLTIPVVTNITVISKCYALVPGRTDNLKCTISGTGAGLDPWVITVNNYVITSGNIVANDQVQIYLPIDNPTADIDLDYDIYYSFESGSSYQKFGTNSLTTYTIDTQYNGQTLYDEQSLTMYEMRPKIFGDTYTPYRFFFDLNGLTLDQSEQIIYQFGTDNSNLDLPSSTNPICYVREYFATGGYKQSTATCTYAVASSEYVLTVNKPDDFDWSASANKYEIILGTDDTSQFGISNADLQIKYQFKVDKSGTILSYKQGIHYAYQSSITPTLTKFYYSSERQSTQSYMYIQFSIATARSDLQTSQLYLIFENTPLPSGLTVGDYIDCELTNFTGGYCKAGELDSNFVLIIDNGTFSSGASLSVAIDDIVLDTVSAYTEFNIKLQFIKDTKLYYKYFKPLFMINPSTTDSSTNEASQSMNALTGTDLQHGRDNVNYDLDLVLPHQIFSQNGAKIIYKFKNTDGPFNVRDNVYTAANLQYNSGSYGALTLLYKNDKTGLYVFESIARASETTLELRIANLKNPHFSERSAYGASPVFDIEFYEGYNLQKYLSINYPSQTAFTLPTYTNTFNLNGSLNGYYDDEIILLSFDLTLSAITSVVTDESLSYAKLNFDTANTELISCELLVGSHNFSFCSLESQTQIRIGGLDIQNTNNAMTIYIFAKLRAESQQVTLQIFNQDHQQFGTDQVITDSFSGTLTSKTLITQIQPLHRKFFKNYYEIQETKLYQSSTPQYIQFIYTVVTGSNAVADNIKITIDSTDYAPTTAADKDFLECSFFKQVGSNTYDFDKPILATCDYDDSDPYLYTISNPTLNLPAGQYLIRIEVEKYGTTKTFNYPTAAQRNEILFTETFTDTSPAVVTRTDTIILNPTYQLTTATIQHLTLTKNYYNYPIITFTPSNTITGGTAASEMKLVIEPHNQEYDSINSWYQTVFTDANLGTLKSGDIVGGYITPDHSSEPQDLVLMKSDSSKNQNFKIVYPLHGDFTAGTSYSIKIPKLKNPNSEINLGIKFYIEECPDLSASTAVPYCFKNTEYDFISHAKTTTDSVNTSTLTVSLGAGSNFQIQATNLKTEIVLQNHGQINDSHSIIVEWDNTEKGMPLENWASYTLSSSNFSYEYYKNINSFIIQSTSASDITSLGKVTILQSTGVGAQEYASNIKIKRLEIAKDLKTTMVDTNISKALGTPQDRTSQSVVLTRDGDDSSQQNLDAKFTVTLTNIHKLPVGGKIEIILQNGLSTAMQNAGYNCYPIKLYPVSGEVLHCYRTSTDKYIIEGFQQVALDGDFAVDFYAQQDDVSTTVNIQVKLIHPNGQTIATYTTSPNLTITMSGSTYSFRPTYIYNQQTIEEFILAEQRSRLQYLTKIEPTNVDSFQYFKFNMPVADVSSTAGIFKLQDTAAIQNIQYKKDGTDFWVDSVFTDSHPVFTIGSHPDYTIVENVEYRITMTTNIEPNVANHVLAPVPSLYKFIGEIQDSTGSAVTEISQEDFLLKPKRDTEFSFTAIPKRANQDAIFQFKYTFQENFVANDEIWLEFVTHNGLNTVFSNDLGWDSLKRDCIASIDTNFHAINDQSVMECGLLFGDSSQRIPAIIKIRPTETATAGDEIEFFVGSIRNPSNGRQSTIILSHRRQCRNDGFMCVISESSNFYAPHNTNGSTVTNFSIAVSKVLEPNKPQTFTLTNVQDNDFVIIKQPIENHTQTHLYDPNTECACNKARICQTFTTLHWILLEISDGSSPYQYEITGMNNGFYRYSDDYQILNTNNSGQRRKYQEIQNKYNWIDSPTMTVNVTQSAQDDPNYQRFVRDFDNIFEIKINQDIWPNRRTYQYILEIPDTVEYVVDDERNTGVSVDGRYCNVTYTNEDSTNINVPYPPRFRCKVKPATRDGNGDVTAPGKILIKSLDGSTANLDGWDTPYADFSIRIYFSGRIHIDEPSGTSNPFVFKSFIEVANDWEPNDDYGIARCEATFEVSPIDLPDLNMLTFNTLSFYDRKARLGNKVEYYMLLEPKTQPNQYIIDKWIFRLPEEFGYPNVLNLDQCVMIGKLTSNIPDCTLNRQDRNTYVQAIPVNYDDHAIKIVRLSFQTEEFLFTAPILPGDHYNISLSMYEGDTLVEKTGINMTDVLGVFFDVTTLQIDLGLDPETLSMFQFDFQLGEYNVQAGYNIESTTIWSRIHFIFESKYGYLNDLGTGLLQGQELGCVVKEGLTTEFTGRLKCEIDLGTNPEDLPTIIVTGYDKIPANQAIKILVTGIKTLPSTKRVDIKIGIELIYNYLGGISAFIYEPTPPPLPAATNAALTVAASSDDMIVSVTGDPNVLGLSDYSFTLTTGGITTDDYLALQFPEDFFEKYSDFSQVTCSDGTNPCTPYVFGISNMIYIQPTVDVASGAVTFTIFGLKNPAFSLSETVQITGFTKIGGALARVQTKSFVFTLNRDLQPCSLFSEVASVADSYIGGQNDVTFQIDFITGHPVPTWGAVTVDFPEEYDIDLLYLGASCSPKDFDLSSSTAVPYCKVGAAKRIDLYLNGYELDQITRYSIEIFGVTTLNIETSDLKFTIASLYYDNIYLQRKICEKQFSFPSLKPVSVKTCDMITDSQYKNILQLSIYTFQFQCKEPIRDETELQVLIPKEYASSNGAPKNFSCFSKETTTLEYKTCQLRYNNDGNLILHVQLQQIESQKRFTVQLKLNNPKQAKTDYQFSANLYSKSLLYLEAPVNNQYILIESNADTTQQDPTSLNMNLINIPKNAGEKSTYIFTLPPHKQQLSSVSSFDIMFPNNQKNIYQPLVFDASIGDNLECSVYIDRSFDEGQFNYHSLLELMSQTEQQNQIFDFTGILIPLECGVTTDRTLTIYDIDTLKQYNFQEYWYSYIIKNVNNPSKYIQGDIFQLQYLQQGKIIWSVQNELKYYVSEPTELIKMSGISISDSNIKNPADYEFQVIQSENFYYMADMAISITLPDLYSDVITYQQQSMTCQLKLNDNNILESKCALYGYEILLWDLEIMSIDTKILEISISQIINPIIEIQCNDDIENDNFFIVKVINMLSNDVQYSTSPSIDDKNCLEFTKEQFNIEASGPSVLQPGLSYIFQFQLEQPADGLKIQPYSNVNGIKFNPQVIEFDSFKEYIQEFQVIVRADVLPGNYWITFEKSENEGDSFYLPILPFQIQVIDFESGVSAQPVIEVGDFEQDSIGYPIICPVYISQYVANNVDFIIELKNQSQASFIKINPQRQTIDSTMLQTKFEIVIDTNKVPESVTLVFSISSFYPTMHQIIPNEKTLKFSRNLNSNTDYPSLSVTFSQIYLETNPNELNQVVLQQNSNNSSYSNSIKPVQSIDIQKEQVKPIIYSKKMVDIQANQATLEALVTQRSTVYYVLTYQGSIAPSQDELLSKTYKKSLGYGIIDTNTIYDINIDYQALIQITNLSGQANYEVHMIASNALGYSDMVSIKFKTSILSYGVVVKIPLRSYVTEEQMITALSKTLRITPDRLIIMREQNQLIQELEDYSDLGDIMINPNLYYEVAIAPNANSDVIKPIELASYLNMESYIKQLDILLPEFDETRDITNRQIRQTSPKIQIEPYQKKISNYSATIGLRLWEQGKVFGIIIESSNISEIPYSNQIFRGDNEKNESITNYRKFSALSEEDGSAYLEFDDLIDDVEYTVFLTVGNNLPYEPLMLYDDDKVRQITFKTPKNINLNFNSASIEYVRVANSDLADAIEKRYAQ